MLITCIQSPFDIPLCTPAYDMLRLSFAIVELELFFRVAVEELFDRERNRRKSLSRFEILQQEWSTFDILPSYPCPMSYTRSFLISQYHINMIMQKSHPLFR